MGSEMCIRDRCRPDIDFAYHISGDEFMVIVGDGLSAIEVGERLSSAVNRPMEIDGFGDYTPSCSIGIVTYSHGLAMDELLRIADDQMYACKGSGQQYSILRNLDESPFMLSTRLREELQHAQFLQLH